MMSIHGYQTKKELKAGAVGRRAEDVVIETSAFGPELRNDGQFAVVGPAPYVRKWYATIHVRAGVITKVS